MMIRGLRLLFLALLLPVSALSCRDSTGPDSVRLYTIPGRLAIVNEGDEPVYSAVFDEELLPLIDWMPRVCDECGRVAPGTTRYVDADSIPGGELGRGPGRWVVVFHWRAARLPTDVFIPGPISHQRIRLDSGLIN